jgi:hypothetical protein
MSKSIFGERFWWARDPKEHSHHGGFRSRFYQKPQSIELMRALKYVRTFLQRELDQRITAKWPGASASVKTPYFLDDEFHSGIIEVQMNDHPDGRKPHVLSKALCVHCPVNNEAWLNALINAMADEFVENWESPDLSVMYCS